MLRRCFKLITQLKRHLFVASVNKIFVIKKIAHFCKNRIVLLSILPIYWNFTYFVTFVQPVCHYPLYDDFSWHSKPSCKSIETFIISEFSIIFLLWVAMNMSHESEKTHCTLQNPILFLKNPYFQLSKKFGCRSGLSKSGNWNKRDIRNAQNIQRSSKMIQCFLLVRHVLW